MKIISDQEFRKAAAAGDVKGRDRAPDKYLDTLRQIRDGITAILKQPKPQSEPDKSAQQVTMVLLALDHISKQLAQPKTKPSWSFTVHRNKDGLIKSVSAVPKE
jgi:hypothetical protein